MKGANSMSATDLRLKIEKIREFDSLIDFSRSHLQLDIVLFLAGTNAPKSVSEIAEALNQRRKPILDALRKLELKGLVKRTDSRNGLYELTEIGKNAIEDLMTILGVSEAKRVLRMSYGKVKARDMIKVVTPINYLHDVLVALGTSRNKELSLNELSKATGISGLRLMMYLEPYTDRKSDVRLFKKVRKESFITKIKNKLFGTHHTDVYFQLTGLGLETFYRLTVYSKIKNNKLLSILVKIFGNYHTKLILRKMSLINILISTTVISLSFISLTVALYLAYIWITVNLLLSILFLIGYR